MQSIHARLALMPSGWQKDVSVFFENGFIKQINNEFSATARSVDILLPAPVNLHSHTFQRALSGLTEARHPTLNDSFWTWRELMYIFIAQLKPEHVGAIAEFAFMEMLETGFAAVAEFHYLHHNVDGQPYDDIAEMAGRIIHAADRSGIGLTLLPSLYMQGGCDGRDLIGGQRRFGCSLDLFENLFSKTSSHIEAGASDHKLGVAPHSLRAVTPDALAQLESICPTGPIHIHLAEQKSEVIEVLNHLGSRPAEWILNNLNVDHRWCLIHCTQMTESETKLIAKSGAIVGLCPITESNLGDGVFNGTYFLDSHGRFGIGTDSNVHISLWHELATLEYSQRLSEHRRSALASLSQSTGRTIFDYATKSGATASGRNSGEIMEGKLADFIVLSADNEYLCHRENDQILDSLIFCGRGRSCITDVWSAGRHVVVNGRHKDRDRIVQAYRTTLGQIKQTF